MTPLGACGTVRGVTGRRPLFWCCAIWALLTACDAARPAPVQEPAAVKPAAATAAAEPAVATKEPRREPSRPAGAPFVAPDADGWGTAGELRYLEVVKGGGRADQALPLVVMIHGLGDRPRDVWISETPMPMRVVMPQAPLPHGGGFSWFAYRAGDNDPAALAAGIARAAGQLAVALELLVQHRPTRGKPIVGGFSQGGMLSYALAVLHPTTLRAAYPVSGMLPRPLWPAAGPEPGQGVPIRAMHGDADRIVPIAPARALVSHLTAKGYDAQLQEFRGVGHRITGAMADRFGAGILELAGDSAR